MKISVLLMLSILLIYILTRIMKQINFHGKKLNNEVVFLFLSCILLFGAAAFRGDFAADYPTYYWQFKYYRDIQWSSIVGVRDMGFFLWSKIVFLLTDNVLIAFMSMSLVMMLMYFKLIKEESCNYLLSIILLVGIDNYIVSFNLMRYILVVSIYMNLTKYIVEKKLKKYLIGVLLLCTLHRAEIVMIPFYWLLSINYRKRKNMLVFMGGIVVFITLFLFTREIAVYIQAIIGMEYNTDSGLNYGSIGSALKSTMLFLVILVYHKKINYTDRRERVWINGCLFAMMFHLLAIKVLMLHRPAYMVSGFFILIIPLITSRISKRTRYLVNTGLIIAVLLYCQFFQNIQRYYPFWQNTTIHY